MTIYLGEKAVGAGTIKATKAVAGDVLHDETLVGNGNTEPLGVDTVVMATTDNLNNKITVVNAAIDGQADAIAKTRKDMNEKDSELESILNEHADELTTLRGNQASLGDQVSNIESKIPESASETNPLITKQQLLDEEMDIRDDYNELVSELQTQITAQAGAIASKQDKLTAGDGISIIDNVISATTAKSEWGKITGELSAQTDLQDALGAKQDKLTAGANIRIEDNVISSTAQESFFRGRFTEWTSVPTSSTDYTVDFHGNTTPSYNDYIVVEDASLYIPQDFLSDPNNVMIRNLHSAGVSYTIEVVIQDQIRRIYYTECTHGVYAQINDWLSVTYEGGAPGVWYIKTNKEFYINNVFTPTANKLLLLKTNTPYETNFYLSEKPGVAPLPIYGSWRFVYHGVWADDNILGWKPEYQVEDTLPMASDTQAGIAKLYTTSGSNTDGAMTQRAVGNAISAHNTATNAHSNIRGVAGGLATLDNNAKVPMSQINDALLGNVSYQGLWNAQDNVPYLADPSGDIQLPKGHYYITSVAGDRFGLHFDVGDWVISTGEGWTKVDNTDAVVAVNGRTGNVVLGANDVGAYTKEEVDALIDGGGGSMPTRYVESINGFTGNVFLGCREIGTYTSVEIDAMIGDIASVLDSINGEGA